MAKKKPTKGEDGTKGDNSPNEEGKIPAKKGVVFKAKKKLKSAQPAADSIGSEMKKTTTKKRKKKNKAATPKIFNHKPSADRTQQTAAESTENQTRESTEKPKKKSKNNKSDSADASEEPVAAADGKVEDERPKKKSKKRKKAKTKEEQLEEGVAPDADAVKAGAESAQPAAGLTGAETKRKPTKKRKNKNKAKNKEAAKDVNGEDSTTKEEPAALEEEMKEKKIEEGSGTAENDTAASDTAVDAIAAATPLSKKQQKRLAKQQKREAAERAAEQALNEPEVEKSAAFKGKSKREKRKKKNKAAVATEEPEKLLSKAEKKRRKLKQRRERQKQGERDQWRQNLQKIRKQLKAEAKQGVGEEAADGDDQDAENKDKENAESADAVDESASPAFGVKGMFKPCNKTIMDLPAIITHDSRHILVASGRDVLIYNMETALVEKTFRGHQGKVIHMRKDPNDPLQMVSVSDQKEVLVWDYEDCSIKKKLDLPVPVSNVVLHPTDYTKMMCNVKISDILGYRAVLYTERLKRYCEANALDKPIYSQKKKQHMVNTSEKTVDKTSHKIVWIKKKAPKWMYSVTVTVGEKEHLSEERPTITYATEEAAYKALFELEVVKTEFSKGIIQKNMQLAYIDMTDPGKTRNCSTRSEHGISTKCYAFTYSGNNVVFIRGQCLTYFKAGTEETKRFTGFRDKFSCLAVHPRSDEIIATGDTSGAVLVWYNMPLSSKSVRLHWHSYTVSDVEFNMQGDYLTSGGDESCLVTWQLEKQTKTVTPRIGAPIEHIRRSDDGQHVAVTFVNNQVHVYSAQTSVKRNSILGFSRGQVTPKGAYDPSTKCIVAVGYPAGILQFYKPSEDRILKSVDVVGENRLSRVKNELKYRNGETAVQHVAFSQDGQWMVTAEFRRDTLLGDERKLKFWRYDESKQFQLNTLVDPPHTSDIATACFQPVRTAGGSPDQNIVAQRFSHLDPGKCLTTCVNGEFKLWSLETSKQVNTEGATVMTQAWTLDSVGKHVKEPIKMASFSHDGKLIATVQTEITIWSLEPRLQVATTLGTNTLREDIKYATFGSQSGHLVGYTSHHILCWSCSPEQDFPLLWCVQASCSRLTSDPFTDCFVALAKPPGAQGPMLNAYVFKGDSAAPVAAYTRVADKATCRRLARSTVFLPTDERKSAAEATDSTCPSDVISDLYAIGADWTISKLDRWVQEKRENITSTKLARPVNELDRIFKLETKPKPFAEEQKEQSETNKGATKKALANMLATPSHVLPAMDAMFRAYASVSMSKKWDDGRERSGKDNEGASSEDESENEKEDSSSDEEEEEDTALASAKQSSKEDRLLPTQTTPVTTATADSGAKLNNQTSETVVNLDFDFNFQSNLFAT